MINQKETMTAPTIEQVLATTNLDELYPVLSALHMTPGWHKKRASLWTAPRTEFCPLHWRYDIGRIALDQAGRWIGTDLAERRNYLLFNPVGDNDYDTVRTLVVAFQMIKPGEYARAHWHTPNAMRLILDASPGCYTVVNGVKLPMCTGDFLLTPGGCWHSHYNEGDTNAYWIDVLDVPLVHLLEPMFFEVSPDLTQRVESEPADHPYYFPPANTMPALKAVPAINGVKRLELDTQAHIPTVAIAYFELAAGSRRDFGRNTANRIFAVISGRGVARVGELTVEWMRGDVIAVPSWAEHEISAHGDSVLLEVSDLPVMRKLGFYREA